MVREPTTMLTDEVKFVSFRWASLWSVVDRRTVPNNMPLIKLKSALAA